MCIRDSNGSSNADNNGASDANAWEINYSGDIEGTVGSDRASSLQANRAGTGFVYVGADMRLDGDALKTVGSLQLTTFPNDDGGQDLGSITLQLLDDVRCVLEASEFTTNLLAPIDGEAETIHLEFSGSVDCDGNMIDVDGFFRKL